MVFRNSIKVVVGCLFAVLLASTAMADQLENGKNDHRGFFLGFGTGPGVTNLRGGGDSDTKAAWLFDIKIGGGLSENWLLMFNPNSSYTQIDDVNFEVYNTPIAVQWYPIDQFYTRLGVGLSFATASVNTSGVTISKDSKTGFGADLAAGYEFRFKKSFSISPEITYHYSRIRSDLSNGHSHTVGGQASLVWFF